MEAAGSGVVLDGSYALTFSFMMKLSILTLLVCVFFDPSNQIFGVKSTVFTICLVLAGVAFLHVKVSIKPVVLVLIVSMLLPLVMLSVGVSRQINWDSMWAVSTFKSYLFFCSLLIFFIHRRYVIKLYITLCAILAGLIVGLFIGLLFGSLRIDKLGQWLSFDVEAAMIGLRTYGDYTFYMIYYKTAVLLIVGVGLLAELESRKRSLFFSLFIIALFLSGTRANIVASCFLTVVYVFCYGLRTFRLRVLGLCLFFPLLLFAVYSLAGSFFDPTELSNSIKSKHLLSYVDSFSHDPWVWFVGQGLGSGFYSIYHQTIAYETELTFLELLRRGGLGGLLFWIAILAYPAFKAKSLLSKCAFAAFAGVVMTNPLLISSTGMTGLAVAFLFINQGKSADVQYRG